MIYDEIVIGAGMSGLYWVYKNKPINYLILEKYNNCLYFFLAHCNILIFFYSMGHIVFLFSFHTLIVFSNFLYIFIV